MEGLDINIVDNNGHSALNHAELNGNDALIQKLTQHFGIQYEYRFRDDEEEPEEEIDEVEEAPENQQEEMQV